MTSPHTITAVAVAVLVAFGVLVLLLFVAAEVFAGRGHAVLIPSPETRDWRVDDGDTLWLRTGEPAVTVTLPSRDLGFGNIQFLDSFTGQTTVLGRGRGCRLATDPETDSLELTDGTGVELVGCAETLPDAFARVTLSGPGGEEYAVYEVEVLPAAPTSEAPEFPSDYLTLRVFVDDADGADPDDIFDDAAGYFDGGEIVGSAVATGAGLEYSLAADGSGPDHAFFQIDSAGQVTVSAAGADDHSGLVASVYTFLARAEDPNGLTAQTHLTVQVVLSPGIRQRGWAAVTAVKEGGTAVSLMKRCCWGFLVVLGMVFLACGGPDPAEREWAYEKVKAFDANINQSRGEPPTTLSHFEGTCRYLGKYGWSYETMRAARNEDRHVNTYSETAASLDGVLDGWEQERNRGADWPPYTLKDFCEDAQREADLVRREAIGRTEEDDRQ